MFSNTLVWVEQLMGWDTGQQHLYDPRNWVITSRYINIILILYIYIYTHTYLWVINQLELGGPPGWGNSAPGEPPKDHFLGEFTPWTHWSRTTPSPHGAFFHVARIAQKMGFLSRHVGTRGLNQPLVDWGWLDIFLVQVKSMDRNTAVMTKPRENRSCGLTHTVMWVTKTQTAAGVTIERVQQIW